MNAVLKTFLISQLRRISYKWPAFSEAKYRARVGKAKNPETGRLQWQVECAHCHYRFFETQTQVDHISPVVPVKGWDSLDGYVTRLFCSPDELQVLCKAVCHRAKTNAENKQRGFK